MKVNTSIILVDELRFISESESEVIKYTYQLQLLIINIVILFSFRIFFMSKNVTLNLKFGI